MGGREVVLATLRQGDFFGEMSVLESMPRDTDTVAVTETKLLVITQGGAAGPAPPRPHLRASRCSTS